MTMPSSLSEMLPSRTSVLVFRPGRALARSATTIVEVMIALMVLSLLLTSLASSWFTLRSVQKLTQEDNKVHEIAQTISERIIGANWDWLGRDRPDETKIVTVKDTSTDPATEKPVSVVERYWRRYAWSWHRRELPRDTETTTKIRLPPLTDRDWTADDYTRFRNDTKAPMTLADVDRVDTTIPVGQRVNPHNLIDLGLLDGPTGLPNLQVYVEYYRANVLDALFTKDLADKTVPYWSEVVAGKRDPDLILPESPFQIDDPELQMNPADSATSMQALVVRIIITWGETPKARRHELVVARRK
jgi:type II secretory pathway pseudopilin PulG